MAGDPHHAAIVVAGGFNLDYVVMTPRLPKAGETVHGRDLRRVPGGKGANQAVAVARLGGEVRLIALVGDDSIGQELLASLADDSVDTRWVHTVSGVPSGVALIAVADDGSNTIIVAPGANAHADASTVGAAAAAFTGARLVMGQLEWPFFAVQALLASAASGVLRVLNAAPADRRALDLLPVVDWLIVNETEAGQLVGGDVRTLAEVREAASSLRASGVANVIVTVGAGGALYVGADGTWHQPAPAVEVVDTTAAGDSFAGALAVALAEGRSSAEALRLAVAAGSLACTVLGARPSLPRRPALEALLPRVPGHQRV